MSLLPSLRTPEVAPSIAAPPAATSIAAAPSTRRGARAERAGLWSAAWPVGVYLCSRLLVLGLAIGVTVVGHRSLATALTGFDGRWYLRLVAHGYPRRPLRIQSTLGFLPAYPLAIRFMSWTTGASAPLAALLVSFLGGAATAVLVERLAGRWWGAAVGRRAVVLVCLFPGSIVFSLAYPEGLTIPLAVACLLALSDRRFVLAGALAGLATAVEPVALVLIPVCGAAAVTEIRRHGWGDPLARRSLWAPLLAPVGIGAFGVFLWIWTGTPLATYLAQHYGWHNQTEPLAILALPIVHRLARTPHLLVTGLLQWNLWNGVLGGVFLVTSLVTLRRVRSELSPGGLALPLGCVFLSLLSVMTPPNARIALVAFPAVLVWARRRSGAPFARFVVVEAALLVGTAVLTLSGHMLP